MKKLETLMKGLIMAVLAVVMLTFSSCGDDDEFVPTETLYELISADADLSEMLGYIDADATLKGYAQGTAAYTLFAPNNAAFDQLRETLGVTDLSFVAPALITSVMHFHFAAGQLAYGDTDFTTAQGEKNTISATGFVKEAGSDSDGAEILATGLATNGTLYEVETILVPPTIFGAIGVNLGTIAQPYLLGAAFTDIVGVIDVADGDVPAGQASIREMLANKDSTITAFLPANQVLDGIAALKQITKEQLIGSLTTSAAAARGFLLNQISAEGYIKGSDLTHLRTITMMTGNTYRVIVGTKSESNPEGITLVNVTHDPNDATKHSPVVALDLILVGDTGEGSNGSAHASAIFQ